ncbi:hypothetical protein DFQ27_009102 [Actinomortierella ambigua]|uniref:Galactose oxidase n=1 Tax=Actinomortierella ambigua TaxID=1343610 RepID=A0A9P6TXK7_9FUNG|nr:hypothetical protein DFQ27_009102 [Actinomortierella ambigua]
MSKKGQCCLWPPRRWRTQPHSLLSLILLLFRPSVAQDQNLPYYAGSVIINNTLYLLGGTEALATPFGPSNMIFTLPLDKTFNTNSPLNITRYSPLDGVVLPSAQVAPFLKDSSRILVVNTKSNITDQPARIYNILEKKWSDIKGDVAPPISLDSVGVALDEDTGLHVVYRGGRSGGGVASQLNIVDPAKGPAWATFNITLTPMLQQPILLFVPSRKETLVMGGCDAAPDCFKTIYFVKTFLETAPVLTTATVVAGSNVPASRSAACVTMIDDSTVLLYGGNGSNKTLSDVWKLVINGDRLEWSEVTLSGNPPAEGREGASCTRVPNQKKVIVAGGIVHGDGSVRKHATPQLAVIDMGTQQWTTEYIIRDPSSPSKALSTPALIGIAAGCTVLLIAIAVGIFCWRRKRRAYTQANSSTMEISTMGSSSPMSNDGQAPFIQKQPTNMLTRAKTERSAKKDTKDRLPLIISPYRPPTTPSTINSNLPGNSSMVDIGAVTGSPYHNNGSSYNINQSSYSVNQPSPSPPSAAPRRSTRRSTRKKAAKTTVAPVLAASWSVPTDSSPTSRPRIKTAYSYSRDSERLDSAARDAQHQAYAKQQMLAEVRRDFPAHLQGTPLQRKETVYNLSPTSPDEPNPDLTSTVMRLRSIELGEESGSRPLAPPRVPPVPAPGIEVEENAEKQKDDAETERIGPETEKDDPEEQKDGLEKEKDDLVKQKDGLEKDKDDLVK